MADGENTPMENGGSGMDDGNDQQFNGSSDSRKEDRKLFVGGLAPGTTEDQLSSYFSKFGGVENVNIKTDPTTGRSRGFAFVSFSSLDAVNQVLVGGNHIINNKKVDCKKAKARIGKIFVGGLSAEISDADIRSYFSQFGNIVEIESPFDKVKNRRKGFCFVSFDSEGTANELIKRPKQTICGKTVDVKRVSVPPAQGGTPMQGGMMGMGRGGGTGRGAMMGGAVSSAVSSYPGYDFAAYKAYGRYDYHNSGYGDYSGYDYSAPAAGAAAYSAYGGGIGGYGGGKQTGRGRQAPRQQPY